MCFAQEKKFGDRWRVEILNLWSVKFFPTLITLTLSLFSSGLAAVARIAVFTKSRFFFLFKCLYLQMWNFRISNYDKNFYHFIGFDLIYFRSFTILLIVADRSNPVPICFLLFKKKQYTIASEKPHVFPKCESENYPSGHAGIFLNCMWLKEMYSTFCNSLAKWGR